MCQLHLTSTSVINYTWQAASELYECNSDGLGFIDFDAPQLAKKIVPKNFQEAWSFIEQNINGRRGVVHWRMRTSGATDVERVHPYVINDDYYLLHNGVMREWESPKPPKSFTLHTPEEDYVGEVRSKKGKKGKQKQVVTGSAQDRSDTQNLAEHLGKLLTVFPSLLTNKDFLELLGKSIGPSNRLIIVNRKTGAASIVNEDTGTWLGDIWQANHYAGEYVYVPRVVRPTAALSTQWPKQTRFDSEFDTGYESAYFSDDAPLYKALSSETVGDYTAENLLENEKLDHPVKTLESVLGWYRFVLGEPKTDLEGGLARASRESPGIFCEMLDELDDAVASYLSAADSGAAFDAMGDLEQQLMDMESLAVEL